LKISGRKQVINIQKHWNTKDQWQNSFERIKWTSLSEADQGKKVPLQTKSEMENADITTDRNNHRTL
jgi:hypothetical protein